MNPRVSLLTTASRINKDFGREAGALVEGASSLASYEVDLSCIKTRLGRFLAQHITSTSAGDPGSTVVLLHAITHGEHRIGQLLSAQSAAAASMEAGSFHPLHDHPHRLYHVDLQRAAILGPQTLAAAFESIAKDLRKEAQAEDHNPQAPIWSHLHTSKFRWPVYGSSALRATNVEAYFDACAGIIRISATVPVAVGADAARPGVDILEGFTNFDTLELVARYDRDLCEKNKACIAAVSPGKSHLRLISAG